MKNAPGNNRKWPGKREREREGWMGRKNGGKIEKRSSMYISHSNISICVGFRLYSVDQFNLLHIFNLFFAFLRKFDSFSLSHTARVRAKSQIAKSKHFHCERVCILKSQNAHRTYLYNSKMAITSISLANRFRLFIVDIIHTRSQRKNVRE